MVYINEPLRPPEAKKLIRIILSEGTVFYAQPHALDRLRKWKLTAVDCENVLHAGAVQEPEFENGEWRYQVITGKITVVIQFLSDLELLVVTAWRIGERK